MVTMTTSLRIPQEIVDQYDRLAAELGRSCNFLMVEALREYLAAEEEDVRLTQEAIAAADRGELTPAATVREEMAALLDQHGVSHSQQAAIRAQQTVSRSAACE